MVEEKNWLVFANRDKCHHAEALFELGFDNWKVRRSFKMSVGDYVYLQMNAVFVSKLRSLLRIATEKMMNFGR